MKQDETTTDEVIAGQETAAGAPPAGPDRPARLPRPRTLIFAVLTLVVAAALGVFQLTAEHPVSGTSRVTGTPQVGGPFELVDHTGRTVTQADFAGRPLLIYFGFTYCPDVCPTSLQVMTAALQKLGKRADEVQPLFITIDPERDTPENMAAYVDHFHERLVGLTGTPEQVRAAATAYRVYYKKARRPGEADYSMDHTDIIYLMNAKGELAAHFGRTTSPEEMAAGITKVLETRG